jgi:hypothetical protein
LAIDQATRIWIRQYGARSGNKDMDHAVGYGSGNKDMDQAVPGYSMEIDQAIRISSRQYGDRQ